MQGASQTACHRVGWVDMLGIWVGVQCAACLRSSSWQLFPFQNMLFVEIPEYRNKHIRVPMKVNFYVINGKRKRSQPQHFTYHPGETFSVTAFKWKGSTGQGLRTPKNCSQQRSSGDSDSFPLSLSFLLCWPTLPCKSSSCLSHCASCPLPLPSMVSLVVGKGICSSKVNVSCCPSLS